MLTMLPLDLITQSQVIKARYVFAVATFQKHRGQGISTRLLDAAHQHMLSQGVAASVLVPALPSLFDFYQRRGYEARFYLDSLKLLPRNINSAADAALTPLSAPDYLRLRGAAFSGSGLFARWDMEALAFMIASTREDGGGALHIRTARGEGCCLYERLDGGVRITELALVGLPWQDAVSILHQHLNAPVYTLRMPQGTLPDADVLPFGMIHWFIDSPALQGEAPYLSLAKD